MKKILLTCHSDDRYVVLWFNTETGDVDAINFWHGIDEDWTTDDMIYDAYPELNNRCKNLDDFWIGMKDNKLFENMTWIDKVNEIINFYVSINIAYHDRQNQK